MEGPCILKNWIATIRTLANIDIFGHQYAGDSNHIVLLTGNPKFSVIVYFTIINFEITEAFGEHGKSMVIKYISSGGLHY